MKIPRRTFLQWAASVVLGTLGLVGIGCRSKPKRREAEPISSDVDAILVAACARLLPSDDGPGAREADCAEYVRRALAVPYLAEERVLVLEGARRLDAVARRDWAGPFVTIAPDAQDRVLTHVQGGGEDEGTFDGGLFLEDLLELTLEGFLGDPRHGGNRGEVGWKFIGYTPGCARHDGR